ncbi:hypothetical protein GCM10027275_35380 [Rhabdobacter roseus]|uniref:Peptidase C1A papain C-terminal domain-containing protein n=1 Tax=Rhabdobacter roseus TaxID=1655419 RepID=A0A840TZA9_9BACT|nr:C1 family peptidase [Rhabdobacter roseus]MBB5285240.1 hypothetical protein [Rhabdobacter roseus]
METTSPRSGSKMTRYFLWLVGWLGTAGVLCAQGMKFDDSTYRKVPQKYTYRATDAARLPPRVDLSMYVPSAMSQGKLGTCVGFSTAYYMRTILEAIRLGMTDRAAIDTIRFSPSYLYNAIKDEDDSDCLGGTDLDVALTYLKQHGVARLSQQPYPDCEVRNELALASQSKIMDYIRLFGLSERPESIVNATRKALFEKTPVVIGFQTTPSLKNLGIWGRLWRWIVRLFGGEDDRGLWKPADSDRLGGGHAICVVGYDDEKFGGAFRAVNSWGKSWGEEGFFWIRYSDYSTYTKYGYQAYLPIESDSAEVTLSGQVSVLHATFVTGNEVPFLRSLEGKGTQSNGDEQMVAYTLRDALPIGSNFYFTANVDRLSYVYVLAASASELHTEKIFPISDTISPIVGANTKLVLPSDKAPDLDLQNPLMMPADGLVYTLVGEPGTEYWLFLFSEKALDIDEYVYDLNESEGNFTSRVLKVFGKDLVPYQQVEYDARKMGFVLRGQHEGYIVPLLVGLQQK